MRSRVFMVCQRYVVLFLLVLSTCVATAAEDIGKNKNVIDVRTVQDSKEECLKMRSQHLSSMNERKGANYAPPKPIPATGAVPTRDRTDQSNPLNRWPYFLPFLGD